MPSGDVGDTVSGPDQTGVTERSTFRSRWSPPVVATTNNDQTYFPTDKFRRATVIEVRDDIGIRGNATTTFD